MSRARAARDASKVVTAAFAARKHGLGYSWMASLRLDAGFAVKPLATTGRDGAAARSAARSSISDCQLRAALISTAGARWRACRRASQGPAALHGRWPPAQLDTDQPRPRRATAAKLLTSPRPAPCMGDGFQRERPSGGRASSAQLPAWQSSPPPPEQCQRAAVLPAIKTALRAALQCHRT